MATTKAAETVRAVEIDAGVIRRALAGNRDNRQRIKDTVCAGLQLVIGPRSAAWEYSYKPRGLTNDGKRHPTRTLRFGDVTTHTANEARTHCDAVKREVAAGRDPVADDRRAAEVEQAQAARRTSTSVAAETYITAQLGGDSDNQTKHQRNEAAHVRAAIKELECGALEPGELKVADMRRLVDMHRARPATGVHRLGALRRFFDSLVEDERIEVNPAKMLSSKSRPKPAKARNTYPDAAEMQALWRAAAKIGGVEGDYLQCLILLPFRRAELADAPVAYFDATSGRMVLEGQVTKNGDDFAIPCPPGAREILKARAKAADNVRDAFLFPLSSKEGEPFHCYSDLMAEWRKESGVPTVKFHDMRRVFVTELAEHQIGDSDLADSLLNHRQAETRGGVKGVYQKAKMNEPRRRMMESWGRLVAHAVEHGRWPREVEDDDMVANITDAR